MTGETLFLAHRIPFPPDRGDKIRSFHILKKLAEMGPVHVACLAKPEDHAHEAGLRRALGDRLLSLSAAPPPSRGAAFLAGFAGGKPVSVAAFASSQLQQQVHDLLAKRPIAAIYVFSGQMAQYLPRRPRARTIMDFVDVDSAKFESYADDLPSTLSWMVRREARGLRAFEAGVARAVDVSLFVSEAEATLFRKRTPLADGKVAVLENGVDLDYSSPNAGFDRMPARDHPLIVFTGQMDYQPNVMAAMRFATDAMPIVRARFPTASFAIVGRNPPRALRVIAGAGVEVTGQVADVRPWLTAADVVVAPLETARGIQNKVLEAMAMGRPVIASSPAFEGIDAAPGLDLLVADGPQATAEAVSTLLADPARAAGIGWAARARMVERYDWERQLAPLAGLIAG